jgi:hypothetical protein
MQTQYLKGAYCDIFDLLGLDQLHLFLVLKVIITKVHRKWHYICVKYYTFRFHHTLCSTNLSIDFTLSFCTADRYSNFVIKVSG